LTSDSTRMKQGLLIIAWAASIALYLALLDAAIETFLAGSPLRWIVVAAIVLYAAATALVWKRATVGQKILSSLAALGILIAYSGWKLGSLDAAGGIVLAQQSTAVVAAALLMTVTVLAAAIVFSHRIAIWLRVSALVVCLYVLLPFALAIRPGSGLSAALSGATFFPANPFWLRGSYLAVEIVLPALFLASVVMATILLVRRQRGSANLLLIAVATLLAIQIGAYQAGAQGLPTIVGFEHPQSQALASSSAPSPCNATPLPGIENVAPGAGEAGNLGAGSGAAGGFSELSGAEQTPAPTATPCVPESSASANQAENQVSTTGSLQAVAPLPSPLGPEVGITEDELAQLLSAYFKLPGSIDRRSFDVQTKATELGRDPVAAFTFVRDQILNEVYPGVLRGANGTLSAQAGNDLDKSLLLGSLLSRVARFDTPSAHCLKIWLERKLAKCLLSQQLRS
jgi:hypothetical protein